MRRHRGQRPVPVFINGGAGNDVISYAGSGTADLEGGAGNDDYRAVAATTVWPATRRRLDDSDTGLDVLVHSGAGKAILHGGGGNDLLVGSSNTDELYGESGSDRLQGRALELRRRRRRRPAAVTVDGKQAANLVVDGGTGTGDKLVLTLGAGDDKVRAAPSARPAASPRRSTAGPDRHRHREARPRRPAPAPNVIESATSADRLGEVTISLGRIATVGRHQEHDADDGRQRLQPGGAGHPLRGRPGQGHAEHRGHRRRRRRSTSPTPTTGAHPARAWGRRYIIDIEQGIRAEGDTLTLMGLGGGRRDRRAHHDAEPARARPAGRHRQRTG